jgi:tRNA (cmo5U34)-methyltransferase
LKNVKEHFDEEAKEFDKTILKLIPHYKEMIDSMISAIPYDSSDSFSVLDLGCGTGNVSLAVKQKYTYASVSCIDIAENMIEMAKIKLENYDDIKYYTGDFSKFKFEGKYDVIVSSLALHHIITDEEKKNFYCKIYDLLNPGGFFINSDCVLGSNEKLTDLYTEKWVEFMLESVTEGEVEEKWLPQSKAEDFPAAMMDHISWLEETGFKRMDIIWKYYGWAVYCGSHQ